MTRDYATGTEGYSLPLCRRTAFNPDLQEFMNNLYSIRRASIKPEISLQ